LIYLQQENLRTMKKKDKRREKPFDAVQFMRDQRDKLSEKLSKMTKEEIVLYFKKRQTESTIKPGG
jgi:hypothetical protein